MQYYFLKNFSKLLNKSEIFLFSLLIIFLLIPTFSWASSPIFNSPLDTTLIIEKDIYPKIVDRQERLIEGKKYVFATINERKGMVALVDNFLNEMARAAGVEVANFLNWNDLKPTDAIKTGQVYYLQEKGKRAKDVVTHVLMPNETLWDVSQKYAIRYKYVAKYNRLDDDENAKIGRVLWLQTKRPKKVPIEIKDVTPIVASFDEEEEDNTAADPELMAEWEELKKTELSGIDNKEKNKTNTTAAKTKNDNVTTDAEEGSFAEFEETTDAKKEIKTTSNVVKYHTVAEAESLHEIAQKYNILMPTLKEWNNLADYTVSTGQKLIVSQPNSTSEDKIYSGNLISEKTDTQTNSSDKKVIVKQNENGNFVSFLDSSGVLLPIPQQDFTPVAPNIGDKNYHIVEKDETLYSIARKYGLNPLEVIRWNGFITGDNIDVGDKIILNSSLALPVGSRSDVKKITSSTTTNNQTTATGSEIKDPAMSGTGANQNKTSASTMSREEIIQAGGNPDNVGKEGYDEIGTPIAGYDFSKGIKKQEATTKAEVYVVQAKDALGKIAQKYSTTTTELMAWNPKITSSGSINIGDTLFVSKPQTIKTNPEQTKKQEAATVYPADYYGAGFHAVQSNETVYHLGEKYVVTVANIRKWNNLSDDIIDLPVGKKMIINEGILKLANNPDASKKEENKTNDATAKVNRSYHTVEKGETLFSIALKYNLSTAQVREWNNRQGDLVYEGEKLIIGLK